MGAIPAWMGRGVADSRSPRVGAGLAVLCALLSTLQSPSALADGPFSWPQSLDSRAAIDHEMDTRPRVATDGSGHWVAVWYSYDDFGGKLGIDADILVTSSSDNGEHWTDVRPLNNNAAKDVVGDYNPDIATDGKGNWITVWYSFDAMSNQYGNDGDIFFARSTDNGSTWTDPKPVNSNAATDIQLDASPHIATDKKGNWVVVWWSQDPLNGTIGFDTDILFSRSTDHGDSWSTVAPLNTNAATDFDGDDNPYIVSDGRKTFITVWQSRNSLNFGKPNHDWDIHFSRSDDGGATWSDPRALNTNAGGDTGDDNDPQLATDGRGNWICVWWSNDTLGGLVGPDNEIFFARSEDNGNTWSDPAALNPGADGDHFPDVLPSIATDGQGMWLVVWQFYGDADVDIWGEYSTDAGKNWRGFFPVNANHAVDSRGDYYPQIATDGHGAWIGVWQTLDSLGGTIGNDGDILFARTMIQNRAAPRTWKFYK